MSESTEITSGRRVTLHYRLTLEDGTEVDSTLGGDPMVFTVGDGTMIEGLERALSGFRAGDRQVMRIEPQEAFGFRDPSNVHVLPRSEFPDDMELARGTVVAFTAPSGDEVGGTVAEAGQDEVKVDFNHPLAGHVLGFEFEILDVV